MFKDSFSVLEKINIYFLLLLIQGVKLVGGVSVLRMNTVTASRLTHTSQLGAKFGGENQISHNPA